MFRKPQITIQHQSIFNTPIAGLKRTSNRLFSNQDQVIMPKSINDLHADINDSCKFAGNLQKGLSYLKHAAEMAKAVNTPQEQLAFVKIGVDVINLKLNHLPLPNKHNNNQTFGNEFTQAVKDLFKAASGNDQNKLHKLARDFMKQNKDVSVMLINAAEELNLKLIPEPRT